MSTGLLLLAVGFPAIVRAFVTWPVCHICPGGDKGFACPNCVFNTGLSAYKCSDAQQYGNNGELGDSSCKIMQMYANQPQGGCECNTPVTFPAPNPNAVCMICPNNILGLPAENKDKFMTTSLLGVITCGEIDQFGVDQFLPTSSCPTFQSEAKTQGCCTKVTCPDLTVANTANSCTGKTNGEACTMGCEEGYVPTTHTRTCDNGVWTGVPLVCREATCPPLDPPVLATGTSCVGKKDGETCTFSCEQGADPNAYATRTCEKGQWSGQPFLCSPAEACPSLLSPAGAQRASCTGIQAPGTCTFACSEGHTVTSGDATRTCGADGNWSGTAPTCTPKSCPPLAFPSGAVKDSACPDPDNMHHGQYCVMKCDAGYMRTKGSTHHACKDGEWSELLGGPGPLVCAPMSCPELLSPAGAVAAKCTGAVEGEVCSFKCQTGFSPLGTLNRTCSSGDWNGAILQCLPDPDRYVYTSSAFGPCSKSCGGGTQTRQILCIDTAQGSKSVDLSLCSDQHPIDMTQSCNIEECPTYTWNHSEWGECSTSCGSGTRSRQLYCQQEYASGSKVYTELSNCLHLPDRPRVQQICNLASCPTPENGGGRRWRKRTRISDVIGGFPWDSFEASYAAAALTYPPDSCSTTCGVGTQEVQVECIDELDNVVADSECEEGSRPSTTAPCTSITECSDPQWQVCAWEACTAKCASYMSASENREVWCATKDVSGALTRVADIVCLSNVGPKPASAVIGCNDTPCTGPNWMTEPWGPCSDYDGVWQRNRSYHCHAADGTNIVDNECSAKPSPITTLPCAPNECFFLDDTTTTTGAIPEASGAPLSGAPLPCGCFWFLLQLALLAVLWPQGGMPC